MIDLAIIGGGIAGLTAAIYASRAGLDTVVIEGGQCGGQAVMTDLVENYPGFYGSGYELSQKIEQQAIDCGVKIVYDDIESVDFSDSVKKLIGFDKTYEAKFVVVATGAKHRKAGFVGEENFSGAGVSYCAVCDGAFFKDGKVAVIGGANTAVSEALYLSNICKEVYLIYRRDKLRADKTLVDRLSQKGNIKVIYNTTVSEVQGNGKVEKLLTNNQAIDIDAVFVAVGLDPATQLFKGILDLDENGYIITDSNLLTNIDNVYAVGDCRVKSLRQMITAASDGALAGNVVAKLSNN